VAAHVKACAELLARHGLYVHVLAARIESSECVPGVFVEHRPELLDTRASMVTRLGEAMSLQPMVVHLHQLDDPEIVEAMRMRAPVVISAHGYSACTSGVYYFSPGHECTRSHGLGCAVNLVARGCAHTFDVRPLPAAYKRKTRGLEALKRADLVIAYSGAVERHLAANGLTRRKVVPLFSTMVPKIGAGQLAQRRVVFAGRVAPPKGVNILIRAARNVDAEFAICGDGWQLEAMRRLARRIGVEQRIHFRGWLNANQLAEELAGASVVVVPSLWPEPFGLVGIEALATGRPVVASSTGGIVDWLEDGVTGLCVRPGDVRGLAQALNELLEDPERQHAMGMAGRKMVAARFSPEHHMTALMDAYRTARSTWQSGL